MKYLNATQAANRLGISDKTMRRWLKEEKYDLHAIRTPSHELMIAEDEIDRVKRERAEYASASQEETEIDAPGFAQGSALAGRVEDLERQLEELRTEIRQIARQDHEALTEETLWATSISQHKPARTATGTKSALPPGAILARDFAMQYGVSPRTFIDHITKGIRGERARVESRPKAGRPGEMERYILPEQESDILDYWQRHNVAYRQAEPLEAETLAE